MPTRHHRAPGRLLAWNTRRLAARALDAATYGDYRPGSRLVERGAPSGAAGLAAAYSVWVAAYRAAARSGLVPVTPLDQWLRALVDAHAAGDHDMFVTLVGEVTEPLAWIHMRAVLQLAADARLALDPEPVWP